MLVTIAIPFFNAEVYLADAIESVINQTYKKWKLILINDGSTDSSMKIAKKYESLDNRISVVSDGKNKNLGFRLNQIPTLVETPFLARMDADDIMHPERIEKQLKTLQENPFIDVLGTNAYTINENSEVLGIRNNFSKNSEIEKVSGFIHPTIMAKTSWFIENPYDVNAIRIEDFELWIRTNKTSNFMTLTQPLLFYREFGGAYYKKYFKGNKSMLYVLKKHKFNSYIIKKSLRYFSAGIIYYMYNLIGKENKLIKNRNQILFSSKEKIVTFS